MSTIAIAINLNDSQARKTIVDLKKEINSLVKFAQKPIALKFDTTSLNASFVKYKEGIKKMQDLASIKVRFDTTNINEQFRNTSRPIIIKTNVDVSDIKSQMVNLEKSLPKLSLSVKFDTHAAEFELKFIQNLLREVRSEASHLTYFNLESGSVKLDLGNIWSLIELISRDIKALPALKINGLTQAAKDIQAIQNSINNIGKTKLNISVGSVGVRAQLTAVLDSIKTRLNSFSTNNPVRITAKIDARALQTELTSVKNALKALQSSNNIQISISLGNALRSLNSLQARLNLLTASAYIVRIDTSTSVASAQNLVNELNRIHAAANNASTSMNALGTNINVNTRTAAAGFSGVTGALRTFGDDIQRVLAVGFGAKLAKDALAAANSFISMNNALTAMLGTQQRAAEANKFLRATAQDLGADFKELVESYTKYVASAKGANISSDQFNESFTRITQAATVLNFTADQTHGIFKALGQIFSKGKVQAEELRGQLGEHLYGAFELVAQGMKKTTAELDTMLKKGELGPTELILALSKAIEQSFGDALPRAVVTGRAEFERFTNTVMIGLDNNKEQIDSLTFKIANDLTQAFEIASAGGTDSFNVLTGVADVFGALIKGITYELTLLAAGLKFIGVLAVSVFDRLATNLGAFKNLVTDIASHPIDNSFFADGSPAMDKFNATTKESKDLFEGVMKANIDATVTTRDLATAAIAGTTGLAAATKNYRKELELIKNSPLTDEEKVKQSLALYDKFQKAKSTVPDQSAVFKNYDPIKQQEESDPKFHDKTLGGRMKKADSIINGLRDQVTNLGGKSSSGVQSLESELKLVRDHFKDIGIYGKKLAEAEDLVKQKHALEQGNVVRKQTVKLRKEEVSEVEKLANKQKEFDSQTQGGLTDDISRLKAILSGGEIGAEIDVITRKYQEMGIASTDTRVKTAISLTKEAESLKNLIEIKRDLKTVEEKYSEEVNKILDLKKRDYLTDQQAKEQIDKLIEATDKLTLSKQKYNEIQNLVQSRPGEFDIGNTPGVMKFSPDGGRNDPLSQAFGDASTSISGLKKNEKIYDQQYTQLQDFYEKKKQYIIQSETDVQSQLTQLNADYNQKRQDLEDAQNANRLNGISDVLTSVSQLMKSKNHEMALIGKAAAIANATINTYQMAVGAYNAMADIPYIGPALGVAAAAAATAFGVANIATIAATPIAHGGLDYVPKETTFLLDKGERVLSPRQNADLTSYLSRKQDADNRTSNGRPIQINFNVNTKDANSFQSSKGKIQQDLINTVSKASRRY